MSPDCYDGRGRNHPSGDATNRCDPTTATLRGVRPRPDGAIFHRAMPTYVYKFVETDETIEIQQSFDEDTLTEAVHPESGKTMPVKKVFQPVGVTFKGQGFYKTDSRSAGSSTPSPSAMACTTLENSICSRRGNSIPCSVSRIYAMPPFPDCELIRITAS